MFNRKKPTPPNRKEKRDLSQYGLFNMPDSIDNDDGSGSGGDSDLEAELAAITSGGGKRAKPKPKVKPAVDLDRMVAESMRDIGSDEELSGDDDDPDLVNELSEITGETFEDEGTSASPVMNEQQTADSIDASTLLKSRIEMYKIAENNAKAAGDTSKMRRFNRGLKTLQELMKKSESGRPIDINEIPPEVTVNTKPVQKPEEETSPSSSTPPQVPLRRAPTIPSPATEEEPAPQPPQEEENPKVTFLKGRQNEYKMAALAAKKSGDTTTAIQFIKIAKQFDSVIKAIQEGQEVDLSNMPPPASEYKQCEEAQPAPVEPPKEESQAQTLSEPIVTDEPEVEETLITASTVGEALQQRLEKYKSVEQAAKDEGNSSKARRFGRIVKQYEDAIKAYKAGKAIPLEDLPTPPGFGPLPTGDNKPSAATPNLPPRPAPAPVAKPAPVTSPQPSTAPRPALRKQDSTRITGNHMNTTTMDRQINDLKQRQKEFRTAALEAKKSGDIEQAKEYLKICKGFDNLIGVAEGGLPVDMATLPIPPSQRSNLEDSFTIVNNDDESGGDGEHEDGDVAIRLQEQLQKQLLMCKITRDHLRALGDVTGTNRFENLALSVQKDLDFCKLAHRKNLRVPKFHYEKKNFNIVKCNTDLTDNEVDIIIVRGINYNVPNPKDIDTYVKIEFPFPQEEPFKTKTDIIRNTENPQYDQNFKIEIQRSNRACQRIFKRQAVKLQVFSKGGFLRSDVLIGTILVKLQPLETACEIHDSFDLMDGRKKIGGKLEIKIRIRNPILTKQIEQINEKWLIIDS